MSETNDIEKPVQAGETEPTIAKQEGASAWDNLKPDHPLVEFSGELKKMLEEADYSEMFGVDLHAPAEEHTAAPHATLIILQKFLRANAGDLALAKHQLLESLKWRKVYKPLDSINEVFSFLKFGGLGYITKLHNVPGSPNETDVATFNIYGAAAKNYDVTFGNIDDFVRWRVALMELTLQQMDLAHTTKTIPDYGQGPDPLAMINVHDYLSVSFFRQPAGVRQSSGKIIDLFQKNYPETVSLRYFVNVPWVMQWMMGAMKMLMSRDSIQKMTWMTEGKELHKTLGDSVPAEYGGKGKPLVETGVETKFGDREEATVDGSADTAAVAKEVNGTATETAAPAAPAAAPA